MSEKRIFRQRAECLIKAVKKRRKRLKEMAGEYKGGKLQYAGKNWINASSSELDAIVSCTLASCSFLEKSRLKNGVKCKEPNHF